MKRYIYIERIYCSLCCKCEVFFPNILTATEGGMPLEVPADMFEEYGESLDNMVKSCPTKAMEWSR